MKQLKGLLSCFEREGPDADDLDGRVLRDFKKALDKRHEAEDAEKARKAEEEAVRDFAWRDDSLSVGQISARERAEWDAAAVLEAAANLAAFGEMAMVDAAVREASERAAAASLAASSEMTKLDPTADKDDVEVEVTPENADEVLAAQFKDVDEEALANETAAIIAGFNTNHGIDEEKVKEYRAEVAAVEHLFNPDGSRRLEPLRPFASRVGPTLPNRMHSMYQQDPNAPQQPAIGEAYDETLDNIQRNEVWNYAEPIVMQTPTEYNIWSSVPPAPPRKRVRFRRKRSLEEIHIIERREDVLERRD
nr:hypothetical protein B0A51_03611 [Rachicladosporium sp. CCFEE 5018]